MTFKDVIEKVSSYAPALGLALGGPAGAMVGSLVASTFGADHSNPQDILSKINADPEAAIKIKTLEFQNAQILAQINSQSYATEVDDRKSARLMNISLHDHMPNILAAAFIIIYAVIQYHVVNHPGDQDDIISARVQDIFVMIISFYFGSAHKKKPEMSK